jgi:hypothetical protein
MNSERPEVHNLRCSNVPVENATAFAAVLALGPSCSEDPAPGARLRSAAWIDFQKLDPGTRAPQVARLIVCHLIESQAPIASAALEGDFPAQAHA